MFTDLVLPDNLDGSGGRKFKEDIQYSPDSCIRFKALSFPEALRDAEAVLQIFNELNGAASGAELEHLFSEQLHGWQGLSVDEIYANGYVQLPVESSLGGDVLNLYVKHSKDGLFDVEVAYFPPSKNDADTLANCLEEDERIQRWLMPRDLHMRLAFDSREALLDYVGTLGLDLNETNLGEYSRAKVVEHLLTGIFDNMTRSLDNFTFQSYIRGKGLRGFFDFVLSRLERDHMQPLDLHIEFLKDRYSRFFSMILEQDEAIRILSEVKGLLGEDVREQRALLDGIEQLDRALYQVCVKAFEEKYGTDTFLSFHKEIIKGIYADSTILGRMLILNFIYEKYLSEVYEKPDKLKLKFSSYGSEAEVGDHLEVVAKFNTDLDYTHVYLVVHLAGEYQFDPNLKTEVFVIDLGMIDSTVGISSQTSDQEYPLETDHHEYQERLMEIFSSLLGRSKDFVRYRYFGKRAL